MTTADVETMRAHVVRSPGGPEVLELSNVRSPEPRDGWVLIGVKAFGLNRAEAITRAGGSGDAVPFPRIIGIECVGKVLHSGGTDLRIGQTVAAVMGGLGRSHDGSYAERTLAQRSNVFPIETDLDWIRLASIPETYLTAWGCLRVTNALQPQQRVLVRPGASALGLAITQIVNHLGGQVVGVTRSPGKVQRLLDAGMADVIVSDAEVAEAVATRWPAGPNVIVDTIASDRSVADDLGMLARGGMVCLAGSLAESYDTGAISTVGQAFERQDVTFYSSETLDQRVDASVLQVIVDRVSSGMYETNIASVVDFEGLLGAHRRIEANAFVGKVVVAV